MAAIIRLATKNDADQMLTIYAPIVTNTSQSFEFEPPTINEMRQRIIKTLDVLPWLSCDQDGVVLGYAYANPHRVRQAYQWSVEVSVYVHPDHRKRGVARALYTSLLSLLGLQGFYNAYAGIALPNDGAVQMHESLGFDTVGIYRGVTFKFGSWHDVGWWQIQLRDRSESPVPPVDLVHARNSQPGWQEALTSGAAHLRP